ncbi:MAG: YaaL family protein [bacterium]|nr:YaaL family protein [bacterium]
MRIRKKQELPEDTLIQEIQRTKMALETAYSNFQNCLDPDLIDCYIYEVNAAQKRYKFLLKQVKTLDTENYA